jgi:CMP-N,N'-diacetyllegionaminic acid synthase
MKILITICARGGSKGIPGKNVKLLNNKHLIAYTIECANSFAKFFDCDIILSTDDNEIKNVAKLYSLNSDYNRPPNLATDSAGKIDTIFDVLKYQETKLKLEYDFVLDLDVTSPLRTVNDLKSAFEILNSDHSAINLFSVNPSARNPYFNMVEKKSNGYFNLVSVSDVILTRQSAPNVYELNASLYFFRRDFFKKNFKSVFSGKSLIYVMPHICFDLDHLIDFEFLDFLLSNHKLDFQI